MHQDSQLGKKAVHTENADIEYILDLFDNKELGLTIMEDREENQRSSTAYVTGNQEFGVGKEEISDFIPFGLYFVFSSAQEGGGAVHRRCHLVHESCIKRLKIEELLTFLISDHSF